jgi:hypothetical protein
MVINDGISTVMLMYHPCLCPALHSNVYLSVAWYVYSYISFILFYFITEALTDLVLK